MPTLDLNKIKIYDAGNTVVDRYTIIFVNRKTRGPWHPLSILFTLKVLASILNAHRLGKRLTLDDLPEQVQQFVKDNFI